MSAPVFNHVSVTCADFERSLAFYHQLVGLPLREQGEVASPEHDEVIGLGPVRLRYAELDLLGGGFLELFEYLQPRGVAVASRTCDPGSVHFALTIDGIEELWKRFDAAGVVTRSRPVTLARGEWAGARAFYALDPDGVTVELIQPPPAAADASAP